MTYIDLINRFWQLDRLEGFSPIATKLYFFLLNECNLRHWENPFRLPARIIEAQLGIPKTTLFEAKRKLKRCGLIDSKGVRNSHTIFTICGAWQTMSEQPSEQPSELSTDTSRTDADHAIRYKNKDKDKDIVEKHSDECQKSARFQAFSDWMTETAPYVAKHLAPLTEKQFDTLVSMFGSARVARNIVNLENRRDLRKRYTSLYRTLRNWCQRDA